MTNPNDIRGTGDAAKLRETTDPEANPVLGSAVDDPQFRDAEISDDSAPARESLGRGELLRRRFLRSKSAWVGMIVFCLLIVLAIAGPMIYQYGPFERDLRNALTGPSSYHWFGVNENGLDIFARTMQGLRISLVIGIGTAFLTSFLALVVGTVAGYISHKGKWGAIGDGALVNLINLFLVIPSILLLMLFSPALQRASWLWMIPLLAGFAWMLTARVLRAMTQQLVRTEYVEAARFMGVHPIITMTRHIIPNIASWIIIDTTLGVSAAILGETGLSFIGFGIQYPQVSLGTVLQGYNISAPYTWVPPAAILAALVISVNLMGEALRDALDPTSGSGRI